MGASAKPRSGRDPRFCVALVVGPASPGASLAAEPAWTVARLFKRGWEIAGFTGASDIRASLIPIRKTGENLPVQCSASYDVARSARVTPNCSELH